MELSDRLLPTGALWMEAAAEAAVHDSGAGCRSRFDKSLLEILFNFRRILEGLTNNPVSLQGSSDLLMERRFSSSLFNCSASNSKTFSNAL
jgi:hypothetical protein